MLLTWFAFFVLPFFQSLFRIVEPFVLEGTLKVHLIPTPSHFPNATDLQMGVLHSSGIFSGSHFQVSLNTQTVGSSKFPLPPASAQLENSNKSSLESQAPIIPGKGRSLLTAGFYWESCFPMQEIETLEPGESTGARREHWSLEIRAFLGR